MDQNTSEEIKIPTLGSIKLLLEPIYFRLENIETGIKYLPKKTKPSKYYRNIDLKNLFGLSNNTIIKYRETGILPYTRLGEVYLYEVSIIDKILIQNKVSL
jgi:hypothetical protein